MAMGSTKVTVQEEAPSGIIIPNNTVATVADLQQPSLTSVTVHLAKEVMLKGSVILPSLQPISSPAANMTMAAAVPHSNEQLEKSNLQLDP